MWEKELYRLIETREKEILMLGRCCHFEKISFWNDPPFLKK
jgi:hypothetical protein